MIGIGGVIGAGLSSAAEKAISSAGPGIVFDLSIHRTRHHPGDAHARRTGHGQSRNGSFSSYASRELGSWAGLSVGWVYAYHWCVTVAFEAIAGAAIANQLCLSVPTWLFSLIFMSALTCVNLAAVTSFARFEFWFAMIKVVAIVAFIAIGIAAVCGLLPHYHAPGATNLLHHGGLFPNGLTPLLVAALTVFFSYFGTELVTIAAGEAQDPVSAVRTQHAQRRRAHPDLLRRLHTRRGHALALERNASHQKPLHRGTDLLGVPGARTIMNLVVLTAVLSCLNSGLYSSSRMLFSLSQRGRPRLLGRTAPSGVPVVGCSPRPVRIRRGGANYFLPTGAVFTFLLSSSGAVAVVVYLCIASPRSSGGATRPPRRSPPCR